MNSTAAKQQASKTKKVKYITKKQANTLVASSAIAIQKASKQLAEARVLANKAGLIVDSNIVPKPVDNSNGNNPNNNGILGTLGTANATNTGGHSNTDHVVIRTGDPRLDRIAELKRNLLRRHRSMQPENRAEDRYVYSACFFFGCYNTRISAGFVIGDLK